LKEDPIEAKNSESLQITEKSAADYGLLRLQGTTLLFEINGGHGYLRLNHKSQGDNTAAFGPSSPPPTAHFITEVETELKIRAFILRSDLDAHFIREEQLVQSVGNGVVEEGRYSKESF
jgi:hypothetical protein